MMENAHALWERARLGVAGAAAVVGMLALTGCAAGAASPHEQTSASERHMPGDALPPITDADTVVIPGAEYADTTTLNLQIEDTATSPNISPYDYLINDTPDGDTEDDLPFEQSAPLFDVMRGSDGALHFKNHLPELSEDEGEVLQAVATANPLLSSAMRAGQVTQFHVRLFKPNQAPDGYDEPTSDMMFIPRDYTQNKAKPEPAIYFFLEANASLDLDTLRLIADHEASHAALGQGKVPELSPEDVPLLRSACQVMRKSALRNMQEASYDVIEELEGLRDSVNAKYAPAFNKVIHAIENGTYASLPLYEGSDELPDCTMQVPWQAVMALAREKHLSVRQLNKAAGEEALNQTYVDWQIALKENSIYGALSESAYLPDDTDEVMGHPYDNVGELTASVLNLMLKQPEAFGAHLKELSLEEQRAVFTVVVRNAQRVKQEHPQDAVLAKYVDQQYAAFKTAAGY